MIFHRMHRGLARNSTITFFNNPAFFPVCEVSIGSRSSTVRGVMFASDQIRFICDKGPLATDTSLTHHEHST